MDQAIDWPAIQAALAAPFAPEEVEWRPASGKGGAGQRVQLVAYIGAAAVMERLDQAVGAGNWSFDWQPLVVDTEVRVAKGTLMVYGVSKSDIGTASNWEPSKGCVSDTLKRCAVQFGIARYLRDIPQSAAHWMRMGTFRMRCSPSCVRHCADGRWPEAPKGGIASTRYYDGNRVMCAFFYSANIPLGEINNISRE